jgi:regulator of replication initiation timing
VTSLRIQTTNSKQKIDCEEQLEELKGQNAILNNQIHVMQANINNLIQENAQKTREIEKITSESQQINSNLAECEADLQQLSRAKQTLLIENFTMKKENDCLREKIEETLKKSINEYTALDIEQKKFRSKSNNFIYNQSKEIIADIFFIEEPFSKYYLDKNIDSALCYSKLFKLFYFYLQIN